jgi:CBS-domain-containing membrane protein
VQAFKEIQKLLNKTHGKTVGEVMTPSPLVVREMTNLEDAAKVLLDTKFRRLPVVDDTGKLVSVALSSTYVCQIHVAYWAIFTLICATVLLSVNFAD